MNVMRRFSVASKEKFFELLFHVKNKIFETVLELILIRIYIYFQKQYLTKAFVTKAQ